MIGTEYMYIAGAGIVPGTKLLGIGGLIVRCPVDLSLQGSIYAVGPHGISLPMAVHLAKVKPTTR